jgi:hypothetical protein
MHLPIVVLPQLGHGNVVSVLPTRRTPHEEQIFSWPDIKLFYLSEAEV